MRCITANVVSGLASLAGEEQAAIINISASNKKKKLQEKPVNKDGQSRN